MSMIRTGAPSGSPPPARGGLSELARAFLKLGFTAFGGPAAHVAMMNEELVRKRGWMSEREFLWLVGAAQLLPGPNSTELAIWIGLRRAGWKGLVLAGTAFILPAALMVLALAAAYRKWGALPDIQGVMSGIQPVVLAVILHALLLLGRKAVKNAASMAAAAGTFAGTLAGLPEIFLLALSAFSVMWLEHRKGKTTLSLMPAAAGGGAWLAAGTGPAGVKMTAAGLFFKFLKIGSVLYGSGYVLVAFLESEFVRTGLLTPNQLLDAVAVGQVTPGPVFTTATFAGYLLGGVPGAAAATLGIFLPAFILVAVVHPFAERLQKSPRLASFLDGLAAASLGIMAHAAWVLAGQVFSGMLPVGLTLVSLALLLRFRTGSVWLIAGGGAVGWASSAYF